MTALLWGVLAVGVGSCLLVTLDVLLFRRQRIVDTAIPERRAGLLIALCAAMVVGPLLAGLLQVAERYLATALAEGVVLGEDEQTSLPVDRSGRQDEPPCARQLRMVRAVDRSSELLRSAT